MPLLHHLLRALLIISVRVRHVGVVLVLVSLVVSPAKTERLMLRILQRLGPEESARDVSFRSRVLLSQKETPPECHLPRSPR